MGNIFLTSDWHFCHDKSFIYEPRGFTNVYDMNEQIIKNFNSVVSPEDDVYCLGDCMLNNNIEGINYIKRLKGNIHIIRGNHDTDARINLYKECSNVVEVCDIKIIKYLKFFKFYLSHYPTMVSNFDDNPKRFLINLCGHSHTLDKFADMDKGIIYHVEVDAHNLFPVPIETVFF